MNNKIFWNTVKPFMTNKGTLTIDEIVIETENDVKIKLKEKNYVRYQSRRCCE